MRILTAGIVLIIGGLGVGYGFFALEHTLAITHQQVNPNSGLATVLGAAGMLFIVLGPIMLIAGAIQVLTKKNIWAAITKPL